MPSFGAEPAAQLPPMDDEHLREVRPDRVAEDDRVGHLHHRRLQVDREEHALALGVDDLLARNRVERGSPHDGGVEDLAGEHRERRLSR